MKVVLSLELLTVSVRKPRAATAKDGSVVKWIQMLRCKSHVYLLITFFCLCTFPSMSPARTWDIFVDGSGDAPTIQAGIDLGSSGDTVLVHTGTYFEAINFRGKNLTLKSFGGDPGQTVIDATGLGTRVVTFSSGEQRAAVILGFTLTGGVGGVAIVNSEASILGNIITGNSAEQDGGGILCDVGGLMPIRRPLISGNTVTNNFAPKLGGGMGFLQNVIPEVIGNHIENNVARDGDGGGICYRIFGDGAVIRNNVVKGNLAGDHGGGIYAGDVRITSSMDAEISWNTVVDNTAKGRALTGNSGGGLWLWQTNAWVHHNTIVENAGEGGNNNYGGGIVSQHGSPMIEQNIIAYAISGGGIWCGGTGSPSIRNNFAWQNSGGNGVGQCLTWWQSDGNVVDNPYFCDMANGDYTVASNSGVMTHPAGPLGAYSAPGCGPVFVQPSTWGALKARYK